MGSYSRGEGPAGVGPTGVGPECSRADDTEADDTPEKAGPGTRNQVLGSVTGGTCEPPGWSHPSRRDNTAPAHLAALVMSRELVDGKTFEELSVTVSASGGVIIPSEEYG